MSCSIIDQIAPSTNIECTKGVIVEVYFQTKLVNSCNYTVIKTFSGRKYKIKGEHGAIGDTVCVKNLEPYWEDEPENDLFDIRLQ